MLITLHESIYSGVRFRDFVLNADLKFCSELSLMNANYLKTEIFLAF